jgi:hypothetical protein
MHLYKGDPVPVGSGYLQDGVEASSLENFLVKAAEEKTADTPNPETAMESDEDKKTVGMTNLYDNPEDRKSNDHDAPWGESDMPAGDKAPGHEDAHHHGDAAQQQHKETRHELLDNVLSGKAEADAAHTKILAENFKQVASGDFESSSPHLQAKSKAKTSAARHIHDEGTLGMRVRDLLGQF